MGFEGPFFIVSLSWRLLLESLWSDHKTCSWTLAEVISVSTSPIPLLPLPANIEYLSTYPAHRPPRPCRFTMPIKRSFSMTPSPAPSSASSESAAYSPSPKKIKKETLTSDTSSPTTPKTPKSNSTATKSSKTPKTSKTGSKAQENGTWTAEKRGIFIDEIIAAGYKGAELDSLADKLNLSKRQLIDQLVPNRNNLRGKAVKGAKGE
ncbi:hypothetical protein BD324DRAFT_683654 [Kockovaella imperatae]|uniref:Uncharacterized protein n=1 Tax=Kockovaella imperatae TaxID=4999 RepID=A0A1Y1U886_9TREE|nr:hypothetical protein BD324DRAFT_683654 [Kockovaella imperatae]ORX34228.1 hypothetical protein BD324DRAFT_683654 [Kockovaella imperatae]